MELSWLCFGVQAHGGVAAILGKRDLNRFVGGPGEKGIKAAGNFDFSSVASSALSYSTRFTTHPLIHTANGFFCRHNIFRSPHQWGDQREWRKRVLRCCLSSSKQLANGNDDPARLLIVVSDFILQPWTPLTMSFLCRCRTDYRLLATIFRQCSSGHQWGRLALLKFYYYFFNFLLLLCGHSHPYTFDFQLSSIA